MGYAARVLVVDDEPIVLESCIRILRREGIAVKAVESARDGLALSKEGKYDAVLLDLRMPDINGLEVLRELKQINPDVRVIMVTGYPSVDSAVEALKLGASDYLVKPFTPTELADTVRRVLEEETRRGASVRVLPRQGQTEIDAAFGLGRSVRTVTRRGTRVAILGLKGIFETAGLFERIIAALRSWMAPIIAEYGGHEVSSTELLRYVEENNKVILLAQLEMGKEPGTVVVFAENGTSMRESSQRVELPSVGFPQIVEWVEAIGLKCDFVVIGVESDARGTAIHDGDRLGERVVAAISEQLV